MPWPRSLGPPRPQLPEPWGSAPSWPKRHGLANRNPWPGVLRSTRCETCFVSLSSFFGGVSQSCICIYIYIYLGVSRSCENNWEFRGQLTEERCGVKLCLELVSGIPCGFKGTPKGTPKPFLGFGSPQKEHANCGNHHKGVSH